MSLKSEYDSTITQRNAIIAEIKKCEEDETVIRYNELKKQNEDLYKQQRYLYKAMKEEEYSTCKHILVYSKIDYDGFEGRSDKSCGCIKCGLDNSVLDREQIYTDRIIMREYLEKHSLNGIKTKIVCDLDLAKAIYSRIKEEHSDIDDELAIEYFKNALENVRNTRVNEDRQASRARRLSLESDFKRWNAFDVKQYN